VNATIQIAPVRKTVLVQASAQHAFEVFTTGIDRWWPKTHGIGATPLKESVIEPFVGGRWYNRCEDGSDVVVGHVRVWQPGTRFVVSWEISADWKPDSRAQYASEVDVRFIPEPNGHTRIELEHRDFERMGAPGEKMRNEVDGGWPAILELYAKEASKGRG
jgi:Activator of Hsp90 ATPase homolog 1-like protein